MSFFSDDLVPSEVRSPKQIMEEAAKALQDRFENFTVVVRSKRLDDRFVLAFDITNRERELTRELFTASHQLLQTYPVAISPPDANVPEFLKKKRPFYKINGILVKSDPRLRKVEDANEWICSTPTAFHKKLEVLFRLDYVKAIIMSVHAPELVGSGG